MNNPSPSLSWTVLVSALAALIGVCLAALSIQGQIADYAQAKSQGQSARDRDRNLAQLHALAQATAGERSSLETLFNTDVLSIADTLKSVGKSAGSALQVSDALPESAPGVQESTPALQAIAFTVKGDGTFAQLMTALSLFEALPIPASIEQVDFVHTPAEGTAHNSPPWHMEARIRVLTAAKLSP